MLCPHCPHCNPDLRLEQPDEDTLILDEARLRAHCSDAGIPILPGAMVWERDAATLMGCQPKTLKNRRSQLDPSLPRFEIRGKARRAVYSLASIAAGLAQS